MRWSPSSKSSPTRRCARAPTNSRSSSPTARRSTTSWFRPSRPCARRAKRTLGQRHFDVQLIGGMVLHDGKIAEMKTGEGKTLVATLPVYLNALAGERRSCRHGQRLPGQARRRMDGPDLHVPRADGRRHRPRPGRRAAQAAYACDVTYGTNNEFGFDYLRDNMKYRSRTWCSAAMPSPSSTKSTPS